jgi:hypothetical protein
MIAMFSLQKPSHMRSPPETQIERRRALLQRSKPDSHRVLVFCIFSVNEAALTATASR